VGMQKGAGVQAQGRGSFSQLAPIPQTITSPLFPPNRELYCANRLRQLHAGFPGQQ
jgi:hypothetical protein